MLSEFETQLDRAADGDEGAIASLLVRHMDGLRAFVRLRCGRVIRERESCSDLVQSVCREVLQGLPRFEHRGETAFRHWLFTQALNKIRDRARYYSAGKRNAAREAADTGDTQYGECYASLLTPSHVAMAREDLERVETVFEEMPEDYREVITLSKLVGLTHAQIAQHMSRTEDSVRNLLHRALKRLSWLLSAGS